MEWNKLLNAARLGQKEAARPSHFRTEYDRDADRVIFSGAFRRLSRKTQVHPLAANDHVHTRLTHSVEAGQVGRALGKAVYATIKDDLPVNVTAADLGSIVQAACLAHDIGNPPFGHAGEEALAHWFEVNAKSFSHLSKKQLDDLSRFDGNAQGFRILTQTENNVFNGGLQITYATLGAFLKYPVVSGPAIKKFSAFLSESEILDEVAEAVGLSKSQSGYLRHPLAYLVEAADDICYGVLDLEDAVELRIVTFDEVLKLLFQMFDEKEKETITKSLAPPEMFRVNLSRLRGPVFDKLVNAAVEGFERQYADIMSNKPGTDVFAALGADDPRARIIPAAKKMGRDQIYKDAKKVEVELGCFATLSTLLAELTSASRATASHLATDDGSQLGWKTGLVMGLLGDHAPTKNNAPPHKQWNEYLCHRRVLDFISGMTDNYATYIAKQVNGMGFTGSQRP